MNRSVTRLLLPLFLLGTGVRLQAAAETLSVHAYDHKRRVGFDVYTGSALTNFPALVRFRGADGFYAGFASTNGYDLRFADADGQRLNFDVERWDPAGESTVWVQVPLLTNGAAIWAYWGNAAAADAPAPCTTDGSTWSQDYRAVWHLDGLNDAGRHPEATGSGFDGTDAGTTLLTGLVANARNFADAAVNTRLNIDQGGTQAYTFSAWAKPTAASLEGGIRHVLSTDDGGFDWSLVQIGSHWFVATGNEYWDSGISVSADVWQHVAAVFIPGTGVRFYKDGVEATLASIDYDASDYAVTIGRNPGFGEFFQGGIDEARVSATARSADWVRAAYSNQVEGSTFATLGPAEWSQGIDNLPVSGIVTGAATLNAVLNAGGTSFYATVYWGPSDGGTNPALWSHAQAVGVWGGSKTNIGYRATAGIADAGTNYYTWRATNGTVSFWARPSMSWDTNREWRGTADRVWSTPGNWIGDNAPDSVGESARFTGGGSGAVRLAGNIVRAGPLSITGGHYEFVDTNASPGALAVNTLQVAGGEATVDVGLSVSGTVTVAGGALTLTRPAAVHAGQFALRSGTLGVRGEREVPNSLNHYGYHAFDVGLANLDGNRGLMADVPWGRTNLTAGPGGRGLDFNSDDDFINAGAVGRADTTMNLFIGYLNAPSNGAYQFRIEDADDLAVLWLDLNRDGVFDLAGGERMANTDVGEITIKTLTGGLSYLFAVVHGEAGGAASVNVQVRTPGMAALATIQPTTDPNQAGLWSGIATGSVDLAAIPVDVAGDARVTAGYGTARAALGHVTVSNGVTLVTAGAPIRFASMTLAPGATTVGLAADAPTTLTGAAGLDGSGAAVTIAKTGSGALVLDKAGGNLGHATFDVRTGALAGVHANAFGTSAVRLDGGELILSSPGGDITYTNTLTVAENSSLTARRIGDGADGPLTVSAAGELRIADGKTLAAGATNAYTLRLRGPITGAGTLCVTGGTVVIDDTAFANLQVAGGTAQLNGELTVQTLAQSGGVIAGLTNVLTVLNAIQLSGPADLRGVTLNVGVADLTVNPNSTLWFDNLLSLHSATLLDDNARLVVDGFGLTATGDVTVPYNSDLVLGGPLSVDQLYLRGTLNVSGAITGNSGLHVWPRGDSSRVVTNRLLGSADVYLGDSSEQWGTVSLVASNAYTGATQLRYASLRAADGVGLPTNSCVLLSAGAAAWPTVWETSGRIARNIGTADGEICWQDWGGGFAAVGGALTVALEGNAPLTWSSIRQGFNNAGVLRLGSRQATHRTELTNPIRVDRSGAQIQTANNQAPVAGSIDFTNDIVRLSGVLSGNLAWNSDQIWFNPYSDWVWGYRRGLLELTATNTYSQRTVIGAVALAADDGVGLPARSILLFQSPEWVWAESVLLTRGTFSRNVGGESEVTGTVSWAWGPGGFAARGGALSVSFPNAGGPVAWGSYSRGFNNQPLQLNSQYADHPVTIRAPINLEGGDRAIVVFDNPRTDADVAILAGALSGITHGQRLAKTGPGTLWLQGTNTFQQYVAIDWGALRVDDPAKQIAPGATISFWDWQRDGNWPKTLETHGSLAKNLSADWQAADCISFGQGSGGFSAYGGPLAVTLHGGATLPWDAGDGGFANRYLHLGSRTANNVVTLANDLDVRGGWRRVCVWDNPQSRNDWAVLAGRVTTTTGDGFVQVFGDGILKLTGNNDTINYVRVEDHATLIVNGTVRCSEAVDTNDGQSPEYASLRNGPGTVATPTLGGTGTILTRDLLLRGWSSASYSTLAPGDGGAGTLRVTTSGSEGLRMNAFATYAWDLGPRTGDAVAVTGNLTLDSGWRLDLRGAGGVPNRAKAYNLFTYTGTFAGTVTPTLVTNNIPANWDIKGLNILHDTTSMPRRIYLTGLEAQSSGLQFIVR
ncbi:MAG: DUF2341 domain-containing protein [Lentisphaerae bacterium]|nr:DUF2341 domain-containing protein [Lentisphaerota bacterium]